MKGLWKVAAAAVLMSVAGPAHAGFAGYRWQVTTIAHGGNPTSIPANDDVYLEFGPGGQFLANEPVNDHFGTYRQVGDGFTTGELGSTLAAYLGGDPVKVLAMSAMSAFDGGVHASTTVRGDRLTVSVDGYLLNCQRDGKPTNL
jgi:heat shock protein HslJ